jgi:hypothetical protein
MKNKFGPWIRFVNVIAKDVSYVVFLRRTLCRKCVRRMLVCIVQQFFIFFGGQDTYPNTAFLTNESFLVFVPLFLSALHTKATAGWSRIQSAYSLHKSYTHRHTVTSALLKCLLVRNTKNKNNVTRIEFSITNYPLNIRKKNPWKRGEETKGYKVN